MPWSPWSHRTRLPGSPAVPRTRSCCCCGSTSCSSGSPCPTRGSRTRCLTCRCTGHSPGSTWVRRASRTRPRCSGSVTCWRRMAWPPGSSPRSMPSWRRRASCCAGGRRSMPPLPVLQARRRTGRGRGIRRCTRRGRGTSGSP